MAIIIAVIYYIFRVNSSRTVVVKDYSYRFISGDENIFGIVLEFRFGKMFAVSKVYVKRIAINMC